MLVTSWSLWTKPTTRRSAATAPNRFSNTHLERAWDENADPFTNAVRITVSALRKRLGEPWIITTVPGAGYRIDTQPDTGREGGERG